MSVQGKGVDGFLSAHEGGFPFGSDHHGIAVVGKTGAVGADPVDRDAVALVFQGSGLGKDLPYMVPGCGPVGQVKEQVIVVVVTAPHRKPEVVADQGSNLPSFEFQGDAPETRAEMEGFPPHGKQVFFIVIQGVPAGAHPHQAVKAAAVFPDDHCSGQGGSQFRGFALHPGHRGAIHALCQPFRSHGESGCEHLRKQNHIGDPGHLHHPGDPLPVGRRIFPFQPALHHCDPELHIPIPW